MQQKSSATLLQRRKKNQSEEKLRNCPQNLSDYNSAPLAEKTLILPPATLAQADTPTRKPLRIDQGSTRKNRPAHAGHARTASGHAWTRTAPRRPQTPPDGRTGGRIASPTATGTAHRGPRETLYTHASETETARNATGKPQDERKINPGEITPGRRKYSTEPPRRRHGKRAGWRRMAAKRPSRGGPLPGRKENPPEALPPAGMSYLSRALSTAPKKIRA